MPKIWWVSLLLSGTLHAQQIVVKSSTGEYVPGAWVELHAQGNNKRTQLTDANGRARFDAVPQKQHLCVRMTGYAMYADTLEAGCIRHEVKLVHTADSLGTVVVTAQWAATTASEAVQQTRVISRNEIDARGAQTLRDVLASELNMRQTEDAVLGSAVSMLGLSGENVKILIDGIPLIGRLNGNIDLTQINLQNIERIEIVEGPLSVSYGTNALAGAINLITKKQQASSIAAETEAFYQSSGQFNASLRLSGRCRRSILAVSGGRNFFDGWSSWQQPFYTDFVPVADSTRTDEWKPRTQHFLSAYSCSYFKRTSLSFNADVFRETITVRGVPRAPYGETAFDDQFLTARNSLTATCRWQPAPQFVLTTTAAVSAFNRTKNTWLRNLTTLESALAGGNGMQDTSQFQLQLLRSVLVWQKDSSALRTETGIDLNRETAFGPRIENKFASLIDAAVFAAAEYRKTNFTLRAGVRSAYNSVFNSPVTPSLQCKIKLGSQFTLRASWAQGFRAPSLKELHFYFVDVNHNIQGNPELKAETANSFMLTLNHSLLRKKMRLQSSLQLFHNSIQNLITLAQITATEYSYINVGKYKTSGITASVKWNYGNWNMGAGASCTGRYNQFYTENPVLPEYTWSPELNGTLQYIAEKPGIRLACWWKYNGRLPGYVLNNNGTVQLSEIDDWHSVDVLATKSFFNHTLRFTAGVRNLANVQTINATTGPAGAHSSQTGQSVATGRQYIFSVQWHFQHSLQ
jgi:outer membrane receptor for ferrienterochelin and colicins